MDSCPRRRCRKKRSVLAAIIQGIWVGRAIVTEWAGCGVKGGVQVLVQKRQHEICCPTVLVNRSPSGAFSAANGIRTSTNSLGSDTVRLACVVFGGPKYQ